jgi:hypothetical protein
MSHENYSAFNAFTFDSEAKVQKLIQSALLIKNHQNNEWYKGLPWKASGEIK